MTVMMVKTAQCLGVDRAGYIDSCIRCCIATKSRLCERFYNSTMTEKVQTSRVEIFKRRCGRGRFSRSLDMPLYGAMCFASPEIVAALLDAGADPEQQM